MTQTFFSSTKLPNCMTPAMASHFAVSVMMSSMRFCAVCSYEGTKTDHVIIVSNTLLQSPEFHEKWTVLNGAKVTVPSKPLLLKNWPPSKLFRFREDKYNERMEKRHQLARDVPNVCSKCGRRCKSVSGLAMHCRSKTCLELVITKNSKLSRLHTPAEKQSSEHISGKKLWRRSLRNRIKQVDKYKFETSFLSPKFQGIQ
mmetsp:Transcript_25125/g.36064  ORF Transcript_25125/g.36064 Transcript_25125/m.36064 type:complete len:200 (+) Transcript_25125:228-827(+)